MIELVLVRHGNTFGPGDPVVWVGRNEDVPLVESGREQARRLRGALSAAEWSPSAALSGGLARQTEHLAIATGGEPAPTVARELDEIDYGPWGGLTTDEIVERFGADEVTAWNERSAWPTSWPGSLEGVQAGVRALADEIAAGRHGERVIACSSNGLLRWFLDLEPGRLDSALQDGTFKMRTGNVGTLRWGTGSGKSGWTVESWNRPPEELFA
ncbi:MAG: histidine phosphatase family protein [Planctomycetota bacterium]